MVCFICCLEYIRTQCCMLPLLSGVHQDIVKFCRLPPLPEVHQDIVLYAPPCAWSTPGHSFVCSALCLEYIGHSFVCSAFCLEYIGHSFVCSAFYLEEVCLSISCLCGSFTIFPQTFQRVTCNMKRELNMRFVIWYLAMKGPSR